MKERPILFSAPMVRALLDGSKTQTRRIMKPQPHEFWTPAACTELHGFDKNGELTPDKVVGWGAVNEDGDQGYVCKYGEPGDRLWVRETWYCDDYRVQNGPYVEVDGARALLAYRADGDRPYEADQPVWKPSIHMPRWASRILLEIVSVRVERLQDISEADSKAEGAPAWTGALQSYRTGFYNIWKDINGADSWNASPWVWVVEFKRVTP